MIPGSKKIFVFGASGHAKVVIDVIEKQGLYQIECLVDDNANLWGQTFYGYQVVGGRDALLVEKEPHFFGGIVAIGDNAARKRVATWLTQNGYGLINAIHPSVQIGRGGQIDCGSVVMAGSVINADANIGKNVIINTGSAVDHDCRLGNWVQISPGVTLCGGVTVGDQTMIGAGATVIPNINIGRGVIVGAGATVIHDIPDNATVVGSPARPVS